MSDEKKNLEKQEKNRMTKSDFAFCGFMIVLMVSNVISMAKNTNNGLISINVEKTVDNFPYMMGFGSIFFGLAAWLFGHIALDKDPNMTKSEKVAAIVGAIFFTSAALCSLIFGIYVYFGTTR